MNTDLFLALHNVNVYAPGNYQLSYTVTITDTYDFAYDNKYYKDLLVKSANNGAWLCQHAGILHPIKISISFIS